MVDRRKANFRQCGQMEKQRWEESEKRREEERRSEKRKSQKKEDAGAQRGRKVAKHYVFPMFCGSEGSKSRLAKAAGAEPCGQMRDEKLHAGVARSTCPSQNCKNTPTSEHFWKLRCRKGARRCGAKRISKSKCAKHLSVGTLLEVELSKKRTPLWREAHAKLGCDFFGWQAQGILHLVKSKSNVGIFEQLQKQWQASGIWRGFAAVMFRGQGADFLRGVASWSIRSSGLLRWFCVTGAALRMTWLHLFVAGAVLFRQVEWKNHKTH